MIALRDRVFLVLIAVAAFVVRAWLPVRRIFLDGYVSFQGDAWYHMRAIDYLIANFPHRLTVDPYAAFGGQFVAIAPLFDYLIGVTALVVGLGHPSQGTIEVVAALMPAALGAVAIVLTFFLGRRLFDARTALLASAVLTIMPGPFLDRTMLGVVDHHAAEIVLTLMLLFALVIAVQSISPGLGDGKRSGSLSLRSSWLAGLALGAYFLTWTSAPFLLAPLTVWLVVQYAWSDGPRRAFLSQLAIQIGFVALGMVLLFQNPGVGRYGLQIGSLAAFLFGAAALFGVARLTPAAVARPLVRFAIIAGVGILAALALAAMRMRFPMALTAVTDDLGRLFSNSQRAVVEAQPLFSMGGHFSWLQPWRTFGSVFYLGVPALVALGARAIARRKPEDALFFVFTAFFYVATSAQNRFGYYLAPEIAILSAWVCSQLLSWAQARRSPRVLPELATVVIVALLFFPSLKPGLASVARDEGLPRVWFDALVWLRNSTPDPFSKTDAYVARYDRSFPIADYSVMSWWDYGYWISRVGRRVPVTNPTQFRADSAAAFLTNVNADFADRWLTEYKSRYVIIDRDLVLMPTRDAGVLYGKFANMPPWVSLASDDFAEEMIVRGPGGQLVPQWVFKPDYYRSMAVHLYWYGSAAVTPANSTWVITVAPRKTNAGKTVREIVKSTRFPTFEAAEAHLRLLGPGSHLLVGLDPTRSAVPLDPLPFLRLAHDQFDAQDQPPAIRIFERPMSLLVQK